MPLLLGDVLERGEGTESTCKGDQYIWSTPQAFHSRPEILQLRKTGTVDTHSDRFSTCRLEICNCSVDTVRISRHHGHAYTVGDENASSRGTNPFRSASHDRRLTG